MKRRVPKKNISLEISDVKHPDGDLSGVDEEYEEFEEKTNTAGEPPPSKGGSIPGFKKPVLKLTLVLSLSFILVFSVIWAIGAYAKLNGLLGYFNLANGEISGFLNKGGNAPDSPAAEEKKLDVFDIAKSREAWSNVGSVFSGLNDFSVAGIGAAYELSFLNNNWANLLLRGGGGELISNLSKLKDYISALNEANGKLSSLNIGFERFFLNGYNSPLSIGLNFRRAENFLGALINWLSSKEERRILVFFENSSEMRPGGGFMGSYADVTFSEGSVKSVDVRDINDADRALSLKIIPPKPLQAIEKSWTIANSNWFFDYPLSASKTMELMEKSDIYAGKSSFDGAIAILPGFVSDILEITGPINLAGRNVTIDKNNFLKEIQSEVQEYQSKGKPSKGVIAELVPELLSRIGSENAGGSGKLTGKILERIKKKDLIFYFKDAGIQSFLDFYGASGRIFEEPAKYNGDYLAVASANIGGGKSDAFLEQKIFFKTQINLDGTASNRLELSRSHTAGKSEPWWYRTPNESYIKVFMPQGSLLSYFEGGRDKKITPKTDYKKGGYKSDQTVALIESTLKKDFNYPLVEEFSESKKNVFGFWVKTDPGKTTKAILNYSLRLFSTPRDGEKYQFVFEKQAGRNDGLKLEIYAPVGFFWAEENSPLFEYESDNPDGRVTFDLTMKKAEL